MVHGVAKLTHISHAIGIGCGALPGDFAVKPLALIGATIGKHNLTSPLGFAQRKTASIDRPVRESGGALTPDLALEPFAGIAVSIRQRIGADAMLFAVQKAALVHAAIVILFGLNGLRCHRGGPCGCQSQTGYQANHPPGCHLSVHLCPPHPVVLPVGRLVTD